MKFFLYIFFIFHLSILSSQFCHAQNSDSLWTIYKNNNQPDTNRLKAIDDIIWNYINNNPDTAILLANQELRLANSVSYDKVKIWVAMAYSNIGASYTNKGNYPRALEFYLKALKIKEEINDKKGIGSCYNNIGLICKYQADYPKALEYYLKSLRLFKETGNKIGIGSSYNNIGNIYMNQSNYPKALEYYLQSLKIREGINDKSGIGACYTNIGLVYQNQANYSKALEYYLKDLKIFEEIGDKVGIGNCYSNIGNVYENQAYELKLPIEKNQSFGRALEYYLKDLKIKKEINHRKGIELCYVNIGEIQNELSNYKLAIQYCDSAVQICKEIGDIDNERYAYSHLADVYAKMHNYKEAYESHVKFKTLTDSIFNADNSKQLGDMKTQFEVEKKETELKAKADAQQVIITEEKKRQQVIIYAVAGVLALVIVFSMFLFNRFRITQKQKQVIQDQKILVDQAYESLHEKNKQVIDSINYARRIQHSLLPTDKYIEKNINRLKGEG